MPEITTTTNVSREFHIRGSLRKALNCCEELFSSEGPLVFANLKAAREFTKSYIEWKVAQGEPEPVIRPEDVYAMGLIDEINHFVFHLYRQETRESMLQDVLVEAERQLGSKPVQECIQAFTQEFPPGPVFRETVSISKYLEGNHGTQGDSGWAVSLEEGIMLWLQSKNPGYDIAADLFEHQALVEETQFSDLITTIRNYLAKQPVFGPDNQPILDMLRSPAIAHPDSLQQQLEFIRDRWGYLLGDRFLRLLRGIDYLNEVNQFAANMGKLWGKPVTSIMDYTGLEEYERFSPDRDWMPQVVMIAKSTLVWLDQLSKQYNREIRTLDQIPDQELDILASRGFNGLWLIGLWERSDASRKIKNHCGNPEAAASAYSLHDYDIAGALGGWEALERLRERCNYRGIRLASDMVPNHTGIDSNWMHHHPDRFLQLPYSPFPSYTFNGENLSSHPDVGIYLEDHYYNQSDAAVVFKRVDFRNGDTRYIYHGNDGTHMPWNDTAQLNYLNPDTREAVIQTIIHVARNFSIIRFDAAMTLAKKHIQRLWFPEPGRAGDIPSRAEHGMSHFEFNQAIPQEFWREVVDRCAVEAPDTLLLAEAFWMMEGYFVRTLGMHRVYNSAFMNMLKNEENGKYRQTIKNTLEFDKDILKRFVNFMNNPDEETAVAQFGKGDKYIGVCTLMVTMPGLPMFGHGQVEGFHEKYGMEYQRAYFNEIPDQDLITRHEQDVFPLMKKRYLFADVRNFYLYDFYSDGGWVNENVFAYSNATDLERALVVYNNSYERTWGFINQSAGYVEKLETGEKQFRQTTLGNALRLRNEDHCYLLLWEQRSGLWFIRKSTELLHSGLYIELNGYSSQVFMNIHEVEDNKFGHYRILHEQLQGRGVKDISQAIRDIILEPVYRGFKSLYSPEYLEKFEEFLGITSGKAPKLIAWFVDSLKAFLDGIQEFLSSSTDPEQITTRYAQYLQNILGIHRLLASSEEAAKNNLVDEFTYIAPRLFGSTGSESFGSSAGEPVGLTLSAFVILAALGEQDDEWYLEGKIQEITQKPLQLEVLFKWIESYESWASEIPAREDLVGALDIHAVVEFIGANYYDGVVWYRKEGMEDFAWWACVYHLLQGKSVTVSGVRKSYQRSIEWLSAMEASGYDLNRLLELVEQSKPKQRANSKTVKKNTSDPKAKKPKPGSKDGKPSGKGASTAAKKKARGSKAKGKDGTKP